MEDKKILEMLKEDGEGLEIPEGISPRKVEETLKMKKARRHPYRKIFAGLAGAACAALMFWGAYQGNASGEGKQHASVAEAEEEPKASEMAKLREVEAEDSYDGVYELLLAAAGDWRKYKGVEELEDSIYNNPAASRGSEGSTGAAKMEAASVDAVEHSETNLRTEGVEEGDIIKNDGECLYVLMDEKEGEKKSLHILRAEQEKLTQVSEITNLGEAVEFYLQGNRLVVLEKKFSEVSKVEPMSSGSKEEDVGKLRDDMALTDSCCLKEYRNGTTEIRVYDISKKDTPKLLGTLSQDGLYETSRMNDGVLYTISRFYPDTGKKEDVDAYVPSVQSKRLPLDCLYLPKQVEDSSYLVLTALSMGNTEQFSDEKAILSAGWNYYASEENIYVLRGKVTEEGKQKTEVFRYSYQAGTIEEKGKCTVPGMVDDSFSVDESKGYLRILTTDWNAADTINALYVLDEDLEVVGSLTGLAKGERIYSARFLGDTAYFVTFRQMDPLFTVDLSNPKEPKVIGELKVTGFSEYLHFYGEGKLLGIGLESDPSTGDNQGVKLSMFDISNPAKVKEINKLVLKSHFYSQALYDYKSVLIHPSKNIIGFLAGDDYFVYSYDEKEGFVQELLVHDASATEDDGYQEVKGAFIGDSFYLLKRKEGVDAYDLKTKEKAGEWRR